MFSCSTNRVKPRRCFALSTKKLINDAIANNDFLKRLEPQHMREMMESMYEKVYTKGQLVIQEGEPGNYLYVLAGQSDTIQRSTHRMWLRWTSPRVTTI